MVEPDVEATLRQSLSQRVRSRLAILACVADEEVPGLSCQICHGALAERAEARVESRHVLFKCGALPANRCLYHIY